MATKTRNIINWVLAGLVAFVFIGSGIGKFMISPENLKMSESMGMTRDSINALGTIEIISAILFLIPRTGILGTLLLAAYMGGAIATHLTHGMPLMAPCAIAAFVWIVAVIRFPELLQRISGKR